jgi:hypothetical protein
MERGTAKAAVGGGVRVANILVAAAEEAESGSATGAGTAVAGTTTKVEAEVGVWG